MKRREIDSINENFRMNKKVVLITGAALIGKRFYEVLAKSGILGLMRYLAAYYAGKHICVNALSPGGIYNQDDEWFETVYPERTMLRRMVNIDDLDGAILFLASDASKYVTGTNLIIDGGWTAW